MVKKCILVPDSHTVGLWCNGAWLPLNPKGRIGVKDGYPLSPATKRKLVKHTRLALKQAQQTVVELAMGLERLRAAPTKNW